MAIDQAEDRFYFFKSQLVGVGIGTVALLITSRIPYRVYRRLALPGFFITVGLLIAVLAVGPVIGGSQRGCRSQDSVFSRPKWPRSHRAGAGASLREEASAADTIGHFLVPVVFTVGVLGGLVILQPDLGTTIIIGTAAMAVIMASDTPLRYVLVLAVLVVLAAWVLAFGDEYRVDRIVGFLGPGTPAERATS